MNLLKYTPKINSIIGLVLHPLLYPLYFALSVMLTKNHQGPSSMPVHLKLLILSSLFTMVVALPTTLNILVKLIAKKYNLQFINKNNNFIYLAIIAVCYLAAMLIFSPYIGAYIAKKIFFSLSILYLFLSINSFGYKLSIRPFTIAAITAIVITMDLYAIADMSTQIVVFMLLSGVVASYEIHNETTTLTDCGFNYLLGGVLMSILLYF